MKNLLIFILLLVGVSSSAQYVPINARYRWMGGDFDTSLHIPLYAGTPSGLRTGMSAADGAIAYDSTNGRFYIYHNSAWVRMANYSELATASRFGLEDGSAGSMRYFSGSDTYRMRIDSLTDLYLSSTDSLYLNLRNSSAKLYIPNIPYNSGSEIVGLGLDTLTNRVFRKTFSSGVTTMAAIGSSPNANGATITGSTLTLQPADGSFGGVVTTGTQTFAGNKTFNGTTSLGGLILSAPVAANNTTTQYFAGSTGGLQSKFTSNQATVTQFADYGYAAHALFQDNAQTEAASGTHRLVSNLMLQPITWNNDGASTTNAATLYIRGSTIGTAAITNNYAMWVDSGLVRIDDIPYNSGAALVHVAQDTVTGILYRKTASGSGTNNANVVNSGFRWLKPGTQEIKTAFGVGISIDSSSNTDGLTFKVDSSVALDPSFTTNKRTQKIVDSLLSIINIQANPKDQYQYYYDMSGETNANYHFAYSGTGSNMTNNSTTWLGNWMNTKKLSLGTTTTGTVYGHYNPSLVYFPMSSAVRYNFGARVRFEDLSDGTETYKFWVGYYDDHFTPPASLLDGVFFTYTHSESSGQFVCHTMNNGTESTTASGVTVAADTDYYLQISVYNGEAKFYINGTLVATISTNIPDDDTARTVSIEMTFKKSAGTTNRDMYLGQFSYGTLSY